MLKGWLRRRNCYEIYLTYQILTIQQIFNDFLLPFGSKGILERMEDWFRVDCELTNLFSIRLLEQMQ